MALPLSRLEPLTALLLRQRNYQNSELHTDLLKLINIAALNWKYHLLLLRFSLYKSGILWSMDFLKSPSPILKKKENSVKCFETQMKLLSLCFGQKDTRFCKRKSFIVFGSSLLFRPSINGGPTCTPRSPPPTPVHTQTHNPTMQRKCKCAFC